MAARIMQRVSYFRRRRILIIAVTLAVIAGGYFWSVKASRESERRTALNAADTRSPAEALPLVMKCLETEPNNADLLRAAVKLNIRSGAQYSDVEQLTERWCKAAPDNREALTARLVILQRLSRTSEAIEIAERLLILSPNSREVR